MTAGGVESVTALPWLIASCNPRRKSLPLWNGDRHPHPDATPSEPNVSPAVPLLIDAYCPSDLRKNAYAFSVTGAHIEPFVGLAYHAMPLKVGRSASTRTKFAAPLRKNCTPYVPSPRSTTLWRIRSGLALAVADSTARK